MIGFEIILVVCFSIIANDVNGFLFKKTKIMTEDEAKAQMLSGEGGVAVVDVGLGDMVIVMKEKMYTCRDLQILGSTVKCPSGYDKFEFKSTKDMCYALRFYLTEEMGIRNYCLSPNYEKVEIKFDDGRVTCKSSTRSLNATFVSEDYFYRLCRRRLTDPIKVHFFAKDRDTMPAVDSIDCSHYTCEFMTYRISDNNKEIHNQPLIPTNMMNNNFNSGPPPNIPQGYPGYLPSGYTPNNRYPPVLNDQSAGNQNNDNSAVQIDTQGAVVPNPPADDVKDDANSLKPAEHDAPPQ